MYTFSFTNFPFLCQMNLQSTKDCLVIGEDWTYDISKGAPCIRSFTFDWSTYLNRFMQFTYAKFITVKSLI